MSIRMLWKLKREDKFYLNRISSNTQRFYNKYMEKYNQMKKEGI